MQFIDGAVVLTGQSNFHFRAADAGRATTGVAFRSAALMEYFFPVPDALPAIDHGVDTVSAFLNQTLSDPAGPLPTAGPDHYWPDAASPCGWQFPDRNL